MVETNEDFGHQIVCIGGVVQVTPREGEERFLPPCHQPVKRSIVTVLEGLEVGAVVVGVRRQ